MTVETDKQCISIIMPSYNSAEYIAHSIESVLSQTYPNWELLLVDDGSSDNSLSIIESYLKDSRIKLLSQQHKGAAKARNLALQEAKGDYVAFLDSDDWWEAEFLQDMLKTATETGCDIAYCGWQRTGLPEKLCPRYVPPDYSQGGLMEALMRENVWPIHSALSRRSLLEHLGGFNETLPCCMDFDLWLRASPDISVALVPKVLSYYRFHSSTQITSQKARLIIVHLEVQLSFLENRPELFQTIPDDQINHWTWDRVRRKAYENFWRGEFTASSQLFRHLLKQGQWHWKDLSHTLFSLLPTYIQERVLPRT
ncbi:glycosyltransferase [Aestuariirhabdus sp. Z084]|uniref:glycosyltransferase family 2 protein n=1 Tax=Aestuariirhabdus haliotis TaxID=2918751 RepID=UPI00201B434F|nr:glycosyltransferase [Aestuariirhabdus haliotis]MCL6414696.1 glycosyltransferase [Aestuariirhabdus haliotis]MCL6418628.1 glycosyltransferase [Aestuariirhabdus haliotis]